MRRAAVFAASVVLSSATATSAAGSTGQMAMLAGVPMHAHTLPGTPTATDLALPGTVFVQPFARVSAVLHDVVLSRYIYTVSLRGGAGSVVNHNGIVVTPANVVRVDLKRLHDYAVNRVFASRYHVRVPADFTRHHLPDPNQDAKLHGCYDAGATSDCAVFVTTGYRVFPYVAHPSAFGDLAELLSTTADVAVLGVGGTNMPTEQLATGSQPGAVYAIGLPQRPRSGMVPISIPVHLTAGSPLRLKASDVGTLHRLGVGVDGAALVDERSAALVGLLTTKGGGAPRVVPVDQVRTALGNRGITALRGAVDTDYAIALRYFAGHHYAHAIGDFQSVLLKDPQHPLATRDLAIAKAKAGGPDDLSEHGDTHPAMASHHGNSSSFPWLAGIAAAAAVALLALGGGLWWRRRRRRDEPGPVAPAPADTSSSELRMPRPAPDGGSAPPGRPEQRSDATRSPAMSMTTVRVAPKPPDAPGAFGPHAGPEATSRPGGSRAGTGQRYCVDCGVPASQEARYCAACGHQAN